MKKIVAISDTHCQHRQIKDFQDTNFLGEPKDPLGGDIIIHAGDALSHGSLVEFTNFINWFSELDFIHRIYVAGNHDFIAENNRSLVKQMCDERGVIYLQDSGYTIDGIKIYGSPQTPFFYDWAFNCARNSAEQHFYNKPLIKQYWDMIPDDVDILITHGPPYGILDELQYINGDPKGQFIGCVDLLDAVNRVRPDIHLFGHNHGNGGREIHKDGTSFYNVSICDEMYAPSNPIRIIEYEKE